MMDPVPLPDYIVTRFDNKTMAIWGYECTQVFRTPSGEEIPTPITASYNHHHGATILGKHGILKKIPTTPETSPMSHGAAEVWVAFDTQSPDQMREGAGPAATTLHEGNGGEYRQSYHGYPKGYAQLVESPVSFNLQPMQIDTWNCDNFLTSPDPSKLPYNMSTYPKEEFVPGPQPANTVAPRSGNPDAIYSGLLECPCTDRITKILDVAPTTKVAISSKSECTKDTTIADAETCANSAKIALSQLTAVGVVVSGPISVVSSGMLPAGCSVTLNGKTAKLYFNTKNTNKKTDSDATIRDGISLRGHQTSSAATPVSVDLQIKNISDSDPALDIRITGPNGVWNGIGLNATGMASRPYAIIVDGEGRVSEHVLGDHMPGNVIRSFTGGQICCRHLSILLDKNQTKPWKEKQMSFHHKWRIYYKETSAADSDHASPVIRDVTQFNWAGMGSPTEYDVPKCTDGVFGCSKDTNGDWVHTMNGTWQVSQMMNVNRHPPNATGISFKTIHGHCHAPTCIVFELWN